jgi:general secretion pathway protein E
MNELDAFACALAKEVDLGSLKESACPPCLNATFPEWSAVEEGLLSEARLHELYAQTYDLRIIANLENETPSEEFVTMIPIDMARQFCMLGLARTDKTITLVVSNPHQVDAIDDVTRLTGLKTIVALGAREQILAAINRAYERRTTLVDEVVEQWDVSELDQELEQLSGQEDLLDMAHRAPVIKLVNTILFEAIRHNASDIHIQPGEQGIQVRFRVDGILYDRMNVPEFLLAPMISRIKIMGRMNVSERRIAQDGRCTARIGNRIIDLRISSIPCSLGERVVLRLLDKSGKIFSLEQLGMNPEILTAYEQLLHSSHGIILITGPTGSGKTTTLYASLQKLQCKEKNILTLEDPIEYQLDGISQTQVNTKKGMTFASGLRHVLRQDPDVIMVGEIRDEETARMAVQSSLTGHLVFSTLHTNDAASAVARMLDLGVEPYLVASSLLGVLAQRLVRKLCPHCRKSYQPDAVELTELTEEIESHSWDGVIHRSAGCAECIQRGYLGRIGIFELIRMNSDLRQLISEKAESGQLRRAAAKTGFKTLRSDGISKVLQGTTSLSEVLCTTLKDEA